jgi:multiple sugar transport system ATP-binding protein
MAQVKFNHVGKTYPHQQEPVIHNFNLTIEDGEFLVLVGPSGCGKSTILRMLAGLEDISAGDLQVEGKSLQHKPPQERDIAMVFQNYALYPHLTVRENIEVPLQIRRQNRQEIQQKVAQIADILELKDLLNRKPRDLSGGQQQRVAMARALVRNPQVLLMDEPLSNLDAKTRVEIRTKISELQRDRQLTTVYVTHDQVEAMTLGDRVVVLREGKCQQVASPKTLYTHPKNIFVADFIGSPSMNIFNTILTKNERGGLNISLSNQPLEVPPETISKYKNLTSYLDKSILAGLRPEAFYLNPEPGNHSLEIAVTMVEDLGYEKLVYFPANEGEKYFLKPARQHQQQSSEKGWGLLTEYGGDFNQDESTANPYFAARLSSSELIKPKGKLTLGVDTTQIYFFELNENALAYQE